MNKVGWIGSARLRVTRDSHCAKSDADGPTTIHCKCGKLHRRFRYALYRDFRRIFSLSFSAARTDRGFFVLATWSISVLDEFYPRDFVPERSYDGIPPVPQDWPWWLVNRHQCKSILKHARRLRMNFHERERARLSPLLNHNAVFTV